MDKTRFLAFRGDLVKLWDLLKQGSQDVDSLFSELCAVYPELTDRAVLPDLVVKQRKDRSGENVEHIRQKLKKKRTKSREIYGLQ